MFYFAYGSNMSLERLKERGVKIKKESVAILYNYELVFNKINSKVKGAGYANVVPRIGEKVEGILYQIEDESILLLDKYEGYPNHYDRDWAYVYDIETKGICSSVIYFAVEKQTKENLLPTQEYINYILEREHLFSPEYSFLLRVTNTI